MFFFFKKLLFPINACLNWFLEVYFKIILYLYNKIHCYIIYNIEEEHYKVLWQSSKELIFYNADI